mgnify:CR=1 FL=1
MTEKNDPASARRRMHSPNKTKARALKILKEYKRVKRHARYVAMANGSSEEK